MDGSRVFLDAALLTGGSVDSGGVGVGGSGVSWWQPRLLDAALLTGGSVDSGVAADSCVGVGRGSSGVRSRQSSVLQPVESLLTQLSSRVAVSTVAWLPPRVSVLVEAAVA